jgi:hypothetical protein
MNTTPANDTAILSVSAETYRDALNHVDYVVASLKSCLADETSGEATRVERALLELASTRLARRNDALTERASKVTTRARAALTSAREGFARALAAGKVDADRVRAMADGRYDPAAWL